MTPLLRCCHLLTVCVLMVSLSHRASAQASSLREQLPAALMQHIPHNWEVVAAQAGDLTGDRLPDHVLVLRRRDENAILDRGVAAPARPLLVFVQQANGQHKEVARNEQVVARADEGGQCDPFLDLGKGLTLKGPYFTVENGVACGSHWTDYITYRYEASSQRFVFHKRITEWWGINPQREGEGDAMVRLSSRVISADRAHPIDLREHQIER